MFTVGPDRIRRDDGKSSASTPARPVDKSRVYNGDVHNGDVYNREAYNGNVHNGNVYKGDVYMGDVYMGDVYKGGVYMGIVPKWKSSSGTGNDSHRLR